MKKSFFVTTEALIDSDFSHPYRRHLFFTKIQSALFPQVTFPKIKIIADVGQQPVSQMSVGVTKVLENAIKKFWLQVLKAQPAGEAVKYQHFFPGTRMLIWQNNR
jgi:hypothetical protein